MARFRTTAAWRQVARTKTRTPRQRRESLQNCDTATRRLRGIVIGRNEERMDDVACALLQLAADTEYLGVKWEAVSLTCAEQCASARATVCIVLVLCSCHDRILITV